MARAALFAVTMLTLAVACESGKPRGATTATANAGATPSAAPAKASVAPSADSTNTQAAGDATLPNAVAPGAASSLRNEAAAPKQSCKVALIGDSLTDYGAHGGGYARYLEERCPESHFVNFAKGGAMVNQMLRRFEETLAREPRGSFTHVVVFGGVNDLYSDETAGRTTTKIEADLTALYAGARALGARVVAITVAPWGGFTRYFTPHRAATTRELNAWILDQTKDGAVDVAIDAFTLLSCGDPDRICARYDRARSDGLHFGKGGHEALGALLYEREFHDCR